MRYTLFAIFIAAWSMLAAQVTKDEPTLSSEDIKRAGEVIGLSFTDEEIELMRADLVERLKSYSAIRSYPLSNQVQTSLIFSPIPEGFVIPRDRTPPSFAKVDIALPADKNDIAYLSVSELGRLIRTKQISALELTDLYLARLEKYAPKLECAITLLTETARERARMLDRETAAGKIRGPLHGIPFGLKDLFAIKNTKTTWGARPYQEQVIDETATVVLKLEAAGAIPIAKLTLGALAWGDVWYGGQTRNPWSPEQGSSGSSAGSASATAAGLVAFSIGTETYGSIVSPATRCGVTGLRPTFGRVSRHGGMTLSWSMDKVGPLCRTVEDCAIVFEAIRGSDGKDRHVIDAPFPYAATVDWSKLRIGYVQSAFDRDYAWKRTDAQTLATLKQLGARLVPIELPDFPVSDLSLILNAEAAAAFDAFTRSNQDDQMVRQVARAWPNAFRAARFIPAVAYIQANRIRYELIQAMHRMMQTVDCYISPTYSGNNLLLTNLTGHPCVVVPNGFTGDKIETPVSISFNGRLFDEATVLAVARAYQEAAGFHKIRPPLFP